MALPSLDGYAYEDASGLWVAQGCEAVPYADGSEEYVCELLAKAPAPAYPVELANHIRDWPSRYHLSHQRTNLLDAIRSLLAPGWNTLELGAGMGALTGWLSD